MIDYERIEWDRKFNEVKSEHHMKWLPYVSMILPEYYDEILDFVVAGHRPSVYLDLLLKGQVGSACHMAYDNIKTNPDAVLFLSHVGRLLAFVYSTIPTGIYKDGNTYERWISEYGYMKRARP